MIHESSFTLLLRPVAPFEQISQTARDLHLLQSSCSAPAFVLSHGARSKLRAPRLLALAVWSACHLLASFMVVFGTKSAHIKEKEIFGGGTNMSELAMTMIPAPLFGSPGFKFKLTRKSLTLQSNKPFKADVRHRRDPTVVSVRTGNSHCFLSGW